MDYESNASDNASQIESELQSLDSYHSQRNYRDFWRSSKEVLDMFKTLKPLRKDDRENLWGRYNGIKDAVKQESAESASKLERELESLSTTHFAGLGIPSLSTYNYGEFWPHAKQVAQMFKETSMFKGDRERLWTKYRETCDKVSRQQDQGSYNSNVNKSTIDELLSNAHYQIGASGSKEEFAAAKDLQQRALGKMKELNLVKSDRETLWSKYVSNSNDLRTKRESVQRDNFSRAMSLANQCMSAANALDPYDTLNEIKATRQELKGTYMNREHWEQVGSTLNHAWNTTISRIETLKEGKRQKHEEYERKHEDWLRRMEDNMARWEGNIDKAENAVAKIEANISDLESKAAEAWSDDYACRVQGWIQENYETIRDIQGNISNWESKISDVRNKMRG